ncbi:MAG: phosphotransferase enzyme family protein [Sphingomonadales bacterium]
MHTSQVQEVIAALDNSFSGSIVHPISGGLINTSFCIENPAGKKVFLQQINEQVFARPEQIAANLLVIYTELEKQNAAHSMAKPLAFENGAWLFRDTKGSCWRIADYIEAVTYQRAERPAQLEMAVKSFAGFTALLKEVALDKLYTTLADFHNLSLRFLQFQEAIATGHPGRRNEASYLIEGLLQRSTYADLYQQMSQSPDDFKKRVMHHDAKLSNLLFDKKEDRVLAVADLDTTMPGFFFSDLGDMVRSMSCSDDENSHQPTRVSVVPAAYSMLYTQYRSILSSQLTKAETELLHGAGLLMIYMQSIRFLTDYLNGDRYYKTERVGQNLDRALHQFTLLCSVEEHLKKEYRFSVR